MENMNRREFIRASAFAASTLALTPTGWAVESGFPVVRTPESKRKFKSAAVEHIASTGIKSALVAVALRLRLPIVVDRNVVDRNIS